MACFGFTHMWTRYGSSSAVSELSDYDLCDCGGLMFGQAKYYRDRIELLERRAERWKMCAEIYRMALKTLEDRPDEKLSYRQLVRVAWLARPQ